MSQVFDKIKSNALMIIIGILLLVSITQCNMNSKIKKMESDVTNKLDSLELIISDIESNMVDRKYMHMEFQHTMYEFLIYEDDIDKGKVSLSDIKLRMRDIGNTINKQED